MSSGSGNKAQKGLKKADVVLPGGVNVLDRDLKKSVHHDLFDALALQHQLIQMDIAVSVQSESLMELLKSEMKDKKNGSSSSDDQYKQYLDKMFNDIQKQCVEHQENLPDDRVRDEEIDKLLEKVHELPPELLYGVRIKQKYVDQMIEKFGKHPQPLYAAYLSESDSKSDLSSSESSSDHEDFGTTDVYNSSRINGKVTVKKAAERKRSAHIESTLRNASVKNNSTASSSNIEEIPRNSGSLDEKPTSSHASLDLDSMEGMLRLVEKLGEELSCHQDWHSPEALTVVLKNMSDTSMPSKSTHDPKKNVKITMRSHLTISKTMPKRPRKQKIKTTTTITTSSLSEDSNFARDSAALTIWNELQMLLKDLAKGPESQIQQAARKIVQDKRFPRQQQDTTAEFLENLPTSNNINNMDPSFLPGNRGHHLHTPQSYPSPTSLKNKTFKTVNQPSKFQEIYGYTPHPDCKKFVDKYVLNLIKFHEDRGKKAATTVSRPTIPVKSWLNAKVKVPRIPAKYNISEGPYGLAYFHKESQMRVTAHDEWVNETFMNDSIKWFRYISHFENQRTQVPCECKTAEALLFIYEHLKEHQFGFMSNVICHKNYRPRIPDLAKYYLIVRRENEPICGPGLCSADNKRWFSYNLVSRLKKHYTKMQFDRAFYPQLPHLDGDFVSLVNMAEKWIRCDISMHRFAGEHRLRLPIHPTASPDHMLNVYNAQISDNVSPTEDEDDVQTSEVEPYVSDDEEPHDMSNVRRGMSNLQVQAKKKKNKSKKKAKKGKRR